MLSDIDPMVITLAVVAVAIVGTVIGVARRGRSEPAPDRSTLPTGADAALWSITEVLPDPRNHLAMKDPTSELRLTARERAAAAEIAAARPTVRPADAARSAQSLAARRAALAKRSAPADPAPVLEIERAAAAAAPESAAAPTPVTVGAPAGSVDLERPSVPAELTSVPGGDGTIDAPRLTLLPEELADQHARGPQPPRWGEASGRAS